jgi:hypothetical protein
MVVAASVKGASRTGWGIFSCTGQSNEIEQDPWNGSPPLAGGFTRMTLHMTPEQVVVTIRRYPLFFLGGFVTFIIGLFTGSHVTMTGLLAVMLGACAAGVGRGVFVRGMWFVAALFWLPSVFIYTVLSYLHVWHLTEHPGDIGRFITLGIATWLIGVQSRFLLTVTALNWRLARR